MGGMSRGGVGKVCAKRVAPPAVPDTVHRHSGSSFGSQGYASAEEPPPDTPSMRTVIADDHSDYGSTVSGVSGRSPAGGGSFTFPAPAHALTHKTAVYYHHQLALSDDQGIDMTQSPGRDSPGSSCSGSRHSSASLDSGRASAGRQDAADTAHRMILQGRPDMEIIQAWLCELQLEEYGRVLLEAGYDLATATRMTPEDLTAVGVRKPNHRKRLKAELANLNVPDNLPDYIPGSLEEWLRLLRLEEYLPALIAQGYRTVHHATQLAWEDLEDMGIVRLGHQKKILLAIKRVKDIRSGKRSVSHENRQTQLRGCRGKSLESLGDAADEESGTWPRSFDDDDYCTLPRRPPCPARPRPVAKIAASARVPQEWELQARRLQAAAMGASPRVARKPPPEPPRRFLTAAEVHPVLALPALPRSESLSLCLDGAGLLPPRLQHLQLSSSTESEGMPFANENAGTIRQNRRGGPDFCSDECVESGSDVLGDIGNMLANLTDELDAMLEEEKRQALADA